MSNQQALTDLNSIKTKLNIAKIGCRPKAKVIINRLFDEEIKRLGQWVKDTK